MDEVNAKLETFKASLIAELKATDTGTAEKYHNAQPSVKLVNAVNDKLERQIRNAHLVVRNVPIQPDAVENDLRQLIVRMATTAGADITTEDIKAAARFKSSKHQFIPIIIKFHNAAKRDLLFSKYFAKLNTFNLKDLGLGDATSRVYLNEHLTEDNMIIFNKAREMMRATDSNIAKVFTRNGLVYITTRENNQKILVQSIAELNHQPNGHRNGTEAPTVTDSFMDVVESENKTSHTNTMTPDETKE